MKTKPLRYQWAGFWAGFLFVLTFLGNWELWSSEALYPGCADEPNGLASLGAYLKLHHQKAPFHAVEQRDRSEHLARLDEPTAMLAQDHCHLYKWLGGHTPHAPHLCKPVTPSSRLSASPRSSRRALSSAYLAPHHQHVMACWFSQKCENPEWSESSHHESLLELGDIESEHALRHRHAEHRKLWLGKWSTWCKQHLHWDLVA